VNWRTDFAVLMLFRNPAQSAPKNAGLNALMMNGAFVGQGFFL